VLKKGGKEKELVGKIPPLVSREKEPEKSSKDLEGL